MSAGMPVNIELYGRLTGRLCRMLELVGVRRLSRPIDPVTDLAKDFAARTKAIDDDEPDDENEELPIEAGLDKSEPGEG